VNRAATPTRTRALAVIAMVGVLGGYALSVAGGVRAASVTPLPVGDASSKCTDFNPTWSQLKVASNHEGTYSSGPLTVTVSNYVEGGPHADGHFDWSSNIGVDGVFVKSVGDKHYVYEYAPASKGDANLGTQPGDNNGINYILFCYGPQAAVDPSPVVEPTPSTDPSPNTDPTPSIEPTPSVEPTPTIEPTPSVEPTPSTEPTSRTDPLPTVAPSTKPTPSSVPSQNVEPTPSTDPSVEPTKSTQPSETTTDTTGSTGDVAGAVGTPQATLPATDTLPATSDQGTPVAALLIVITFVATIALVARRTTRARR